MPPAQRSNIPRATASNESPVKFQTLDEYNPGQSVVQLIYGASGSGKTQYAGSAGHQGRAVFINIGGGAVTLKNPIFRKKYPLAGGMIMVTVDEDVNPANAEAYDKVTSTLEWLFNNKLDQFDSVIVDDITALRRFAMNKGIELNGKVDKSKTKTIFKNEDIALVGVQDYAAEMSLTEAFIIELVAMCKIAGKHLVMTAHERNLFAPPATIGGEPVLKKTMPGFTGKTFPDAVTGLFDCTWHAEAVGAGTNTAFRMRTLGSESLTCNTKWGGIFKPTEDGLDFPTVVARIQEASK
jgi:hypothetical protein